MNPILAMLFGGQTRTERKDLTKAKDFPPFLLNATKKLAKAIGKVSPILGAMLDMEAGFMLLDGSATANGAKRCRSFAQEQHRIVNSNGDTLVGTLYKADVLVPTVNVDRVLREDRTLPQTVSVKKSPSCRTIRSDHEGSICFLQRCYAERAAAVSSASSIICVNDCSRSSGERPVPFRGQSEMVQMASAFFPARAAVM